MDSYEIVIDHTDVDGFKRGLCDIREQLGYIQSQIIELETNRDRLIEMRNDAINNYCDPDSEIMISKIWIPKHIAKLCGD